jgi:flagellar protein FliO/FliZ
MMKTFAILMMMFVLQTSPFVLSAETEATAGAAISAQISAPISEPTSAEKESQIPIQLKAAALPTAVQSGSRGLFAGLAVVLFVAGLAAWGIRKYSISNRSADTKRIKVLTQYHLGPKKSLAVVQIAGESVLIGVTDHHISHIRTLSLLSEEVEDLEGGSFGQVAVNRDLTTADKEELKDEFKMSGLNQLRGGL